MTNIIVPFVYVLFHFPCLLNQDLQTCLTLMSVRLQPMFSSRNFMGFSLTVRSCMVCYWSKFHSACDIPVFPIPFIDKIVLFSILCSLIPCHRCPCIMGLFLGLSILFHWSMCLFLCQWHTVFTIIAVLSLKSGSVVLHLYSSSR